MFDEMERGHLAQANRHIDEAIRRIAKQELLVAKLEQNGRDTTVATELLSQFQDTLRLMIQHRDMILRALDSCSEISN